MGWIESRVNMLEQRVEGLLRLIQDMQQALNNALQQARNAQAQYPTIGPGGGGGCFFCQPASIVAGASGTWPSITAASFTADVYIAASGSVTLVASDAIIYNYYGAGLAANKTTLVQPDGAGNYTTMAESCT